MKRSIYIYDSAKTRKIWYNIKVDLILYYERRTMDNLFREKLAVLVGQKQDYYLERFEKMEATNSKVSWNWCAFLVSIYWMVYRRMYLVALVYYVGIGVITNIPYIGWIMSIAIWICTGLFGNYVYYEVLKKRIAIADATMEPAKSEYIKKNTGVSSTAVWVVIGAGILISIIATVILVLVVGVLDGVGYY